MKLHHDPKTDSLYTEHKDAPGVETREIDVGGEVVGLDLNRASGRFDLTKFETVALPFRKTATA